MFVDDQPSLTMLYIIKVLWSLSGRALNLRLTDSLLNEY